jgi:SAM-dependent methyltransferase
VPRRADRRRLRAWPRVAEAAAICAAGHDWPLMPPARALDLLTVQAGLIEGALTRAHRAVNPAAQSPEAAALGAFADIAYPAGRFVALAHLALRVLLAQRAPPPYRFLDVGAGGGMKVALAADLFREADGVEVDPAYAAAARATLAAMGATRCRIEQADGAAFDGYAAYDVLYFYQPMRDPGGLTELEAAIAAGARPGAVLIAPYEAFAARAAPLGLAALTGFVFVKGLAEDGVAPLLSAVARIGPHPVDPSRGPAAALGWLGPLWLACEMNGIRPGYLGGGLAAWT